MLKYGSVETMKRELREATAFEVFDFILFFVAISLYLFKNRRRAENIVLKI